MTQTAYSTAAIVSYGDRLNVINFCWKHPPIEKVGQSFARLIKSLKMWLELMTLLVNPPFPWLVKKFSQPQTHTIDSNFQEAAVEAARNTTEL